MIRERGLGVAAQWLARLVADQDCLACRGCSRGALLCAFCRRELPRCGAALDRAVLARACSLDALAVRFDYAEPLRSLVARFKYHGELALAPALAALLPPPPAGAATLVAVPPDPLRLRQRGYDHVALLAGAYARRQRLARVAAWRTHAAPAQAGLGRRSRAENLKDVFRVARLVPAQPVLLLDDVLTTGATLRELAACCRAAGAARVTAVVLARTPARRELTPE